MTGGAGADVARPAHDQGHPDAAFKRGALGPLEWPHVGRAGKAPVVRHEDHQGVLGKLVFVQGRQHPSDFVVQVLEHRHVRLCVRLGPVGFIHDLLPVARPLEWKMRALVGNIEEEGPVPVMLNEVDGGVGDEPCHVSVRVDRQSPAEEYMQVTQFAVVEVVHVAAEVSEEGIPPVSHRVEPWFVAQVPFAEYAAGIAGGLQGGGEQGPADRQSQSVFAREADRLVVAPDVTGADGTFEAHGPLLVLPCEECGPCRAALRSIGVMLGEADAIAGELVDYRGLCLRMPIAAEIAIAQVVGEE